MTEEEGAPEMTNQHQKSFLDDIPDLTDGTLIDSINSKYVNQYEGKITFCCSTYNTLNYLKLAIKSVRENAHFKDAPFVVHAENCDDGTNEWLHRNVDKYNLEVYTF